MSRYRGRAQRAPAGGVIKWAPGASVNLSAMAESELALIEEREGPAVACLAALLYYTGDPHPQLVSEQGER